MMSIRKSKMTEKIYIFCLSFWTIYNILFNYSTLSKMFNITFSAYFVYVDIIILMILFFRVFMLDLVYSYRQITIILFSLVTALCVFYSSGSRNVLMIVVFVICAKDLNIDRVLSTLYKCELVICSLIIISSFTGFLPNRISLGTTTSDIRYCLGFLHPNACGIVLVNLALLHFYTHKNNIKWWNYLFVAFLLFVDYRWPKSKSGYFIIIFMIIGVFLIKHSDNWFKKNFIRFLKILPVILVLLVVLIIQMYINQSTLISSINRLLTERISQMVYFLQNYSILPFGQKLEIVSSSQANTLIAMHTLDNSYLYCLLGYGVLTTILFTVGYLSTIRFEIRKKEYYMILILVAIFIWGFSETTMIKLECNPFLIMFAEPLFIKANNKAQIKMEEMLNVEY